MPIQNAMTTATFAGLAITDTAGSMPTTPTTSSTSNNATTLSPHAKLRMKPGYDRLVRYAPVRRLRKTLYGDTVLCRDTSAIGDKDDGENDDALVVLKRVNLQALRDNLVCAHESPAEELRVVEMLHRTGGHANVVRYVCRLDEGDASAMFVSRGDLYTVMEFCEGGDLFDLTEAQPLGRVPEREALRLVREIAAGLAFLHAQGVAHRDLSLENVLLHCGTAKICDFGLSCDAGQQDDAVVGKSSYMAPEVARGALYEPRAADVWSLGVVLFTLLTGSPLVADEAVRERMLRVVATYGVAKVLELWGLRGLVGTATLALLSSLLQVDARRRPSAAAVLAHPAFWTLQARTRP